MTRRFLLTFASFVIIAVATCNTADAFLVDPSQPVQLLDGPGNGGGGVFFAKQGTTQFGTFCVERNESFSIGDTYSVTIDAQGAIKGGVGGGNPDPLRGATRWLYYSFFKGNLESTANFAGFTWQGSSDAFDTTDTAAIRGYNTDLQNAFWFLEEELDQSAIDSAGGTAQDLIDLAIANEAAGDALGDLVQVMNVWDLGNAGDEDFARQSQLIIVPEAATVAGWAVMAAIMGCVIRLRRRRSR